MKVGFPRAISNARKTMYTSMDRLNAVTTPSLVGFSCRERNKVEESSGILVLVVVEDPYSAQVFLTAHGNECWYWFVAAMSDREFGECLQ